MIHLVFSSCVTGRASAYLICISLRPVFASFSFPHSDSVLLFDILLRSFSFFFLICEVLWDLPLTFFLLILFF